MKTSIFVTLYKYRSLLFELVIREFTGRYRGTFGGIAWSFAQPLFLLAVYTLAFGVILKARWGYTGDTKAYSLILFAGLIVFNTFSECLKRAPTLITSNPNLVKKVIFPLEILPVVMVITSIIHLLISLGIWFAGYIVLFGFPQSTSLYLFFVLGAFAPILLGIGWLLAALGVVVRDIDQLFGLVSQVFLFLTPIFFSIDAAPRILQKVFLLNPLTFIVEQLRQALFFGINPNFKGLTTYFFLATIFSTISLYFFRRLQPTFGDLV